MTMWIRYFVSVLIFTLVFSCQSTPEKKNLVDLPEQVESEKVNLSSLMKDYTVIPLETTENDLLGDVMKVIQKDNRFYILSGDYSNQKLSIYDSEGHLLKKIARQGQGGEQEYLMIKDFDVYGDKLLIMDYRRLLFCDLDGRYLYSKPLDFVNMSLKMVSDGEILFYVGEKDNTIYVTDSDANIKEKYLPFTPALSLLRYNSFLLVENAILFQKGMSIEYWKYDPSRKERKDVFFIQEENGLSLAKEDELMKQYGIDRLKHMEGLCNVHNLAGCSDQFSVIWQKNDQEQLVYGSLKTGDVKRYKYSNIIDDVTFNQSFFTRRATNCQGEKAFVSYAWPPVIAKGLDKFAQKYPDRLTDSRYVQMKELVAAAGEDANPFLIVYKFKL